MTRSANTKTSSLTKGMGKQRRTKDKPRGQSGTHRLKLLNAKENKNCEVVENVSWLRHIFRK